MIPDTIIKNLMWKNSIVTNTINLIIEGIKENIIITMIMIMIIIIIDLYIYMFIF